MARHRAHRPFQLLTAATLAAGLVPVGLAASLSEPLVLAGAFAAWSLALYLWAATGSVLAATTFAPGEPMRPGWLLLSASYFLLLPVRFLAGASLEGLADGASRAPGAVAILNLASAACGLVGFLVLARAWRASGLDLTTRASRVAARLVALAISLALAGPDLWERFPAAAAGDPLAIADVLTDALDGAIFVVAVPVARAALALGGGLVAWPWGLLTLSLLAWLGYDAAAAWGLNAGLSPRHGRVLVEVMRTLGACGVFAAGIAQRWLMQGPPGGANPQA